jgi:hypothetical protein
VSEKIIGCILCGWVTRADLFEDEDPACVDCGGPLREMELGQARRLVAARRRADERRRAARNAAEIGLGPTDFSDETGSEKPPLQSEQ